MSHTHSPRAVHLAQTFENLSVAAMQKVQSVYAADYYRFKSEGLTEAAQSTLMRSVNPMGEAIDMRDGTCRECAAERAA